MVRAFASYSRFLDAAKRRKRQTLKMKDEMQGATIVFDLDGTLVDTAPDLTNALNHALVERGHAPVSLSIIRSSVGYGARAMIEEALRRLGREDDVEAMLASFLAHYEAHIADESRPFPGALEALRAFSSAGARLAICTNKREHLALLLLRALGLETHFHAVGGRDTFPVFKPDPGHLIGTIERAGGSPLRAVMVGDSEVDVVTAKAAQIGIVGVSFGYAPQGLQSFAPDAVIDHFRDLVPAAAALLSAADARAPE